MILSATAQAALPAPSRLTGQPIEQINLKPPRHHHSSALGIAELLRKDSQYSLAVVAENVKPAGAHAAYALWLRRGRSSVKLLGFIAPEHGHPSRLRAEARLRGQLWQSGTPLITRETRLHPKRPGVVILRGTSFFCPSCGY